MYTYETIIKMNTLAKKVNRIGHVFAGIFFGGILCIFIIVGILLVVIGSPNSSIIGCEVFLFFAATGVYGVFFLPKVEKMQKEIQRIYKETFLEDVFDEFFDKVEYKWNKGFDKDMITQADVFKPKENFRSEDYLSGSYKGVFFEHADISWETSSGNAETQMSFDNDTYQRIIFHFKQDKLYVGVSGKDSFDPGIFKQMDYSTEKERIRKDIQVIIDVIEMLNMINVSVDERNITERR